MKPNPVGSALAVVTAALAGDDDLVRHLSASAPDPAELAARVAHLMAALVASVAVDGSAALWWQRACLDVARDTSV